MYLKIIKYQNINWKCKKNMLKVILLLILTYLKLKIEKAFKKKKKTKSCPQLFLPICY